MTRSWSTGEEFAPLAAGVDFAPSTYRHNARRLKAAYARYPSAPMAAACVQQVAGARPPGQGLR